MFSYFSVFYSSRNYSDCCKKVHTWLGFSRRILN
uniref:Uncharacterized protein n=1 Tax=Anguilla anguilla TaxID=7936 RepID=A0A0E9TJK4_ANGAN